MGCSCQVACDLSQRHRACVSCVIKIYFLFIFDGPAYSLLRSLRCTRLGFSLIDTWYQQDENMPPTTTTSTSTSISTSTSTSHTHTVLILQARTRPCHTAILTRRKHDVTSRRTQDTTGNIPHVIICAV